MKFKRRICKCGNKAVQNRRKHRVKQDIIGKRFGRLTAIKVINQDYIGAVWLCKCDCGNEIMVRRKYLISKETESCGCRLKESMENENNPMWKGDKVGYYSLHTWVKNRIIKPNKCQMCSNVGFVELSNIGHTYKRNLTDWEWLCRKCHMIKDGRMEIMKKGIATRKK
ncbi:MAG: hypothetical protein IT235_07500 [Bacteroidia bacterium]|nr:hypothetical protein [Bacteroidia bacterium]